jgi:hypothetical protein
MSPQVGSALRCRASAGPSNVPRVEHGRNAVTRRTRVGKGVVLRRARTAPRTARAQRLETVADLLRLIRKLPGETPEASRLARTLVRRDYGDNAAPREQKEHWTGWLGGYDGPGYYGRQNWNRSPAYVYNHLHCAPMLLWLAEHAGVPRPVLRRAARATLRAGSSNPSQAAALRSIIPWSEVEHRLFFGAGAVEARLRTWIPDASRRSALVNELARSCAQAAQQAPRCWGVSFLRQKISLNVGMVNVFILGSDGTLDVLVRPELLPPRYNQHLKTERYSNARRSRMLSFDPAPRRAVDYQAIREAHNAAINECSVTRLSGYPWESAHSTALIRYLSAATGIPIRDSRYRIPTSRENVSSTGFGKIVAQKDRSHL